MLSTQIQFNSEESYKDNLLSVLLEHRTLCYQELSVLLGANSGHTLGSTITRLHKKLGNEKAIIRISAGDYGCVGGIALVDSDNYNIHDLAREINRRYYSLIEQSETPRTECNYHGHILSLFTIDTRDYGISNRLGEQMFFLAVKDSEGNIRFAATTSLIIPEVLSWYFASNEQYLDRQIWNRQFPNYPYTSITLVNQFLDLVSLPNLFLLDDPVGVYKSEGTKNRGIYIANAFQKFTSPVFLKRTEGLDQVWTPIVMIGSNLDLSKQVRNSEQILQIVDLDKAKPFVKEPYDIARNKPFLLMINNDCEWVFIEITEKQCELIKLFGSSFFLKRTKNAKIDDQVTSNFKNFVKLLQSYGIEIEEGTGILANGGYIFPVLKKK